MEGAFRERANKHRGTAVLEGEHALLKVPIILCLVALLLVSDLMKQDTASSYELAARVSIKSVRHFVIFFSLKFKEMYGDLYARDIIVPEISSMLTNALQQQDCRGNAIVICNTVFQEEEAVDSCEHGAMHEGLCDYSKFSESYVVGHLIEKFKCGGLRNTDLCIDHRTIASECQDVHCASRLVGNSSRYAEIHLSHSELRSPNVATILTGELLSRLRCY